MRVLCCPIQQICAFNEFWSNRMLSPVHLQIMCECFGQKFMFLKQKMKASACTYKKSKEKVTWIEMRLCERLFSNLRYQRHRRSHTDKTSQKKYWAFAGWKATVNLTAALRVILKNKKIWISWHFFGMIFRMFRRKLHLISLLKLQTWKAPNKYLQFMSINILTRKFESKKHLCNFKIATKKK